ncbi:hypothetical protein L207DRAFT_525130 [Hyaloscypha variabilis F]|uniref:Prion-inhibition and propagation HeLo domain-containing protein n=1 Tax=Hyaloscypha variabilis (strain UAMH 11265 / GT02V1 / F) TaxID=1149755 RepID=A0A2J6S4U1_HYAVF|nr:hypothetical protein L207DRAFT_525130 [Hyaloscypha variabilis F]
MAEAAGLALGGISLASMFSSCVEILEYFEHGRNWLYDFSLAQTKVDLMKVRLSQLGKYMQVETCVAEASVLESNGQPAPGTGSVSAGLLGITKILGRTTALCSRYSAANPDVGPAGPTKQSSSCSLALSPASFSFTRRPQPRRLSNLGKKVCWAVHDKKKFEGLISDFECLLSNLERITDGLENGQSPEQILSSEKDSSCRLGGSPLMDNKKPPKKPKVATRQPATVRPLASSSRSSASDLNHSSQPQALEVSGALSSTMSSWIRNHSLDQSIHLVGPQVDDEYYAVECSQPGNYRYEENLSFDQSLAITGPTSQKTLELMTKTWLELAKHAVDRKTEDCPYQ